MGGQCVDTESSAHTEGTLPRTVKMLNVPKGQLLTSLGPHETLHYLNCEIGTNLMCFFIFFFYLFKFYCSAG